MVASFEPYLLLPPLLSRGGSASLGPISSIFGISLPCIASASHLGKKRGRGHSPIPGKASFSTKRRNRRNGLLLLLLPGREGGREGGSERCPAHGIGGVCDANGGGGGGKRTNEGQPENQRPRSLPPRTYSRAQRRRRLSTLSFPSSYAP